MRIKKNRNELYMMMNEISKSNQIIIMNNKGILSNKLKNKKTKTNKKHSSSKEQKIKQIQDKQIQDKQIQDKQIQDIKQIQNGTKEGNEIGEKIVINKRFIFTDMDVMMFSKIIGYVINDKQYLFEEYMDRDEFNQHLKNRHNINFNMIDNKRSEYNVIDPDINIFSICPYGYVNINSNPENSINTKMIDESFNIVIMNGKKEVQILNGNQLLKIVKEVILGTVKTDQFNEIITNSDKEITANSEMMIGPQGFQGAPGPRGEEGKRGEPGAPGISGLDGKDGKVESLEDIIGNEKMIEYENIGYIRYIFSISPEIFNKYVGIGINLEDNENKEVIDFEETKTYSELLEYMRLNYGLYKINKDEMGVDIPTRIRSLALKPEGYMNKNAINMIQMKYLTSRKIEEQSLDILVNGERGVGKLKDYKIVGCGGNGELVENYYGKLVNGNEIKTIINKTRIGSQYFNDITKQIFIYNGTKWVEQKEFIYNGNVIMNNNGEAIVQLPKWMKEFMKSETVEFAYQLTAIGTRSSDLYIKKEIYLNNETYEFIIGGEGILNTKVSWQIIRIKQ